jgi:hypothetical protein
MTDLCKKGILLHVAFTFFFLTLRKVVTGFIKYQDEFKTRWEGILNTLTKVDFSITFI